MIRIWKNANLDSNADDGGDRKYGLGWKWRIESIWCGMESIIQE